MDAVRCEHAPAEEVIAALRADLERIAGRGRARSRDDDDDASETPRRTPARRPAPARATAKKKTSRR